MSWLYYLLEANLYLILFCAFYYFVLRRETWYQYNRAYLLATSALAFVIPFVQLGMLKPTPVVPTGQLQITQINFAPVSTADAIAADTSWAREDYCLAAYLLIACCLLINLAVKIYRLVKLSRLNSYKKADKLKIIETDENKGAFSFFNYLFISPQMALSETVIAHELVHIRQKHSWDIVYFEIIKVVSWFNPIAYLLQHSIKELHEFIADNEIAGDASKINQYTDFLLGNAYGVHESQLTNNIFNKSLLKKRIMMLHQKRSGNSARLKYLLVLPLSAGLLCASTLAFAKSYGWIDIAPKHTSSDIPAAPAVIKTIPATIAVSHKDWIHYSLDPSRYTAKTLNDIAADCKTKGYQMDFKDYKDGNAAMLKISLRKSEAAPNSATSNTFRIDELKKTGDVIFLGFNKKKNVVFVRSEKVVVFPKPKSDTTLKSKKIRKVADSVIRGETKSIIRGKIDSTINKKTNSIIKKEITGGTSFKLPWSSPGFNNLFIYLGKNIHYPAAEYDKRIVGNVVVEFTVSNEYKITDVKVMKDAHPAFANEVVRATKRYTDTINRPPGTYVLGVQFNLVTEKMTKTWLPKGLVNDIDDKPNYAGIIETVGYIKE